MNALETFFSVGPLPGLLGRFPYYAQLILGIGSLFLLAWAVAHVAFLGGTFCSKASVNIKDAFMTTAAPTIGLSRVINFTNEQAKINETTQGGIQEVSNSTEKLVIQNQWFKSYVTETLANQQSDIDYLKLNCVCKTRSPQCISERTNYEHKEK